MSPGMDPSSFSGLTRKGMAFDISSAFKETKLPRDDYERVQQRVSLSKLMAAYNIRGKYSYTPEQKERMHWQQRGGRRKERSSS